MQTFTTQKQSISPTVTMVIHQSSEPIVTLSFPNGGRINTLKVNHFTHRCECEKQLSLQGPCTAYLVSAGIEMNKSAYYLVLFNETQQCHSCSCYDYRKAQVCKHVEAVNQHVAPVQPIVIEHEVIDVETKRTVADWREIQKRDKERQRKEWSIYWHEAKLLQLQAQQSPRPQVGA